MPQDLAEATEMIQSMRNSIAALGQRCLTLEQKLQQYGAGTEEDALDNQCRLRSILHLTIYYETGHGYNEEQKIARSVILDGIGWGKVHFHLPEDASGIRLDPDDYPCVMQNFTVFRPGRQS